MMIIFLQNSNSKNITETEIFSTTDINGKKVVDIHSSVNLIFYSNILLHLTKKQQRRFIEDMYIITELRDFYHKSFKYNVKEKDIDTLEKLFIEYVKELYKNAADKYDLKVVCE